MTKWKAPDGMTCKVHSFDSREGGAFSNFAHLRCIGRHGQESAHTDTYFGRFVEIVPNERVVEVDEFETADPALQGEMRITMTLSDENGGTRVVGVHEGLPAGVPISDNEAGWQMALGKLAALVESGL
jgi:uncharacterized protein YndB with AHSA1/START domain